MPKLRQTIGDDARRQICSTTRRKTDKEPHHARRISFRKGTAAKRRKRRTGGELQCSATRRSHDIPQSLKKCAALLHVLDVFGSGAERLLCQRGLRELIDVAVEHRPGVRG